MRARRADLVRRLAPHVPARPEAIATGSPRSPRRPTWALWGHTRRLEELAQVIDRWALLVSAGAPPDAAAARIVGAADVVGVPAHRDPCVIDELRPVLDDLTSGVRLADAVDGWATATRCPWVTLLAAELRDAATVDATVTALDRVATMTRQAAQRACLRRLRRRSWTVWLAGAGTCTATAVAAAI
jgi:hypothetical protein